MYRRIPLLMVGSLVLPPAGAHAQVLQPSELCSVHAASAVATFEDAHLEARVRRALPAIELRQGGPVSTHDRVGVQDVLEDLSADRETILASLHELDMDLAMGKVSREDHAEMKASLEGQALRVLAALETERGRADQQADG